MWFAIKRGLLVLLLYLSLPLAAQENAPRPSGLFFNGALQYYPLPPEPFKDPWPGLRLGAGWELPLGPGSLSLALETGFTYSLLTGPRRPADSVVLTPLLFQVDYSIPLGAFLGGRFSLRPALLAGGFLSLAGGEVAFTPSAGPRLYGEFLLGGQPLWRLYAGGGVDLVLQSEGLATMPVIELGFRINIPAKKKGGEAPQPIQPEAVRRGHGDARSIQRLRWAEDESAVSYEVTVERLNDGNAEYQEVLRETENGLFIDCFLVPGKYRYQVKASNVLGREGESSEWVYFEIRSAAPSASADPNAPVQRLEWDAVEFALSYQALIEQREPTGQAEYREIMRIERTDDTFLEVSLPPGEYRYQVIGFDLLGRPGTPSDWVYFEILPTLQPELSRFSPRRFYLDKGDQWTITLDGKHLAPESEVYLRSLGTGAIILPAQAECFDTGAKLAFNRPDLIRGNYEIMVKTPRGETAGRTFRIQDSPLDILMETLYTPLFPLEIRLFDEPFNTIQPFGGGLRIALIPFKTAYTPGRFGSALGFEFHPGLNLFTHSFQREDNRQSTDMGITGVFHFNLLYQLQFPNRNWALHFRAGGGISFVGAWSLTSSNDSADGGDSGGNQTVMTLVPSLAAGISLQWFIQRPFYINLGIEYLQLFVPDDLSFKTFRPSIGMGLFF